MGVWGSVWVWVCEGVWSFGRSMHECIGVWVQGYVCMLMYTFVGAIISTYKNAMRRLLHMNTTIYYMGITNI